MSVRIREDEEVSQQFGRRADEAGLAASSGLKALDVVRQQIMEKRGSVCSSNLDKSPCGPIEEPSRRADSAVFRFTVAKSNRDDPLLPRAKSCSSLLMEVMEDEFTSHHSVTVVLSSCMCKGECVR